MTGLSELGEPLSHFTAIVIFNSFDTLTILFCIVSSLLSEFKEFASNVHGYIAFLWKSDMYVHVLNKILKSLLN